MSSSAAERLALRAAWVATGIIRPRVPTLFMKPESSAATPESAMICLLTAPPIVPMVWAN